MQLFTGNFVLNARFDRCNKLEIWPAPFLPPSACFDSKNETVKTAIEFSVIKIFGALNSGNSLMQRTDTKLTRFDPLIPISIAKNKSKKSNLTYCSIHHLTGDFTPPLQPGLNHLRSLFWPFSRRKLAMTTTTSAITCLRCKEFLSKLLYLCPSAHLSLSLCIDLTLNIFMIKMLFHDVVLVIYISLICSDLFL